MQFPYIFSTAYIILILKAYEWPGIPAHTAFITTLSLLIIATIVTSVWTKRPIIVGPAMVLNTFLLTIMNHNNISEALGVVATSGVIILLINAFGFSRPLYQSIPDVFYKALMFGIGLLMIKIAFLMNGIDSFNHLFASSTLWFLSCMFTLLMTNHMGVPGASLFTLVAFIAGHALLSPHSSTMPSTTVGPPHITFSRLSSVRAYSHHLAHPSFFDATTPPLLRSY